MKEPGYNVYDAQFFVDEDLPDNIMRVDLYSDTDDTRHQVHMASVDVEFEDEGDMVHDTWIYPNAKGEIECETHDPDWLQLLPQLDFGDRPARYAIDGHDAVLETREPSNEKWNGWAVPRATPREVARYLYDLAQKMEREAWAEAATVFWAYYAPDPDEDTEVSRDQPLAPDGLMWRTI